MLRGGAAWGEGALRLPVRQRAGIIRRGLGVVSADRRLADPQAMTALLDLHDAPGDLRTLRVKAQLKPGEQVRQADQRRLPPPGRAQPLVGHHDAVDIDHLLPLRRVGHRQPRRAVDQPQRMAGVQPVAKAVPRFICRQRPVVQRRRGLAGGAVADERADPPLIKQIPHRGGVLRIAPEQGLQGGEQASHTDGGGVRVAEDLQRVGMVLSGGQSLGVEGQLTEGKQGGGNALITFGGGHNMQLLCGDHGEKIAADAPQAEPGFAIVRVGQAVWLGIVDIILPGHPRPDRLVKGQLARGRERRKILAQRHPAAALDARGHLFFHPHDNRKTQQEANEDSEIAARG